MYSQQDASRLRQEFWTVFGQYMKPVPSASGEKINWINYKTGIKKLSFHLNADNDSAYMGIHISGTDEKGKILFDQLKLFRAQLEELLDESWAWEETYIPDNGATVSRVYKNLRGPNISRKEDWPALIAFFKPRLIAWDAFWTENRDIFEMIS